MDTPNVPIPPAPSAPASAAPMPVETSASKPTIRRNASWGAIISIIIILAMVIVGAFYAWGERIAEYRALQSAGQSGS